MNFAAAKVLNKINEPMFSDLGITLFVKRDDLVHPVYGGNKFRKLKYNLLYAKENNFDMLLTFGGAFSNHIAATAFAGKEFGYKTIGIIRGEELLPPSLGEEFPPLSPGEGPGVRSNKTLREAKENGMELKFVSRKDYKRKYDEDYLSELRKEFGNVYIIPEGGSNELALPGCKEITEEIEIDFDYLVCPVGTGTTLLGIVEGLKPHQTALGIEVYKNQNPPILNLEFLKHCKIPTQNLKLETLNYSLGGYGKSTTELDVFCKTFSNKQGISIEPIYSGKMFFGIYDLAKQRHFPKGSIIVAIHTGGLQYL